MHTDDMHDKQLELPLRGPQGPIGHIHMWPIFVLVILWSLSLSSIGEDLLILIRSIFEKQ